MDSYSILKVMMLENGRDFALTHHPTVCPPIDGREHKAQER